MQAKIDQSTFLNKIHLEHASAQSMQPISVFACRFVIVPIVALNFGNNSTNCREEWSQQVLVAITRIQRLTRICQDEEVLANIVEFAERLRDLNVVN